ncbi:MAG TPA: TlpA disulfide reductase family protein [Pyrinomonadaceae bacterium]|nr:TlpA disulfide reductase family protein [Pyrinomonadaceae bacterium]
MTRRLTRRFWFNFALTLAVVLSAAAATRAQEAVATGASVSKSERVATDNALKLEGQIVCSVCWFESDDRVKTPYGTAADLKCAVDCAAKGVDAALAVREGAGNSFALYLLEDGRFDKGAKNWLAYMGKRVEVSGTTRPGAEGKRYLKVDALRVVADEGGGAGSTVLQDAKVIGTEAELALSDLFGAQQRLSALKGRIVVLNFWATYCEPCRKEMPDLARIQNDYAALGVQVVGASADEATARAKVLQFIKETKLNFPVWLGATTGDMQRFGLAPVLPGTVIIGRDGRIVWHKSGVIKESDVKRQLDALLQQATEEGKRNVRAADGRANAPGEPRADAPDVSGAERSKASSEAADEKGDEHASSVPS